MVLNHAERLTGKNPADGYNTESDTHGPAHLDGLARVPGHRTSDQLAVQVVHRPAGLLLPAGRRGGDFGAFGQVEVRRVQAVPVYPVGGQLLRQRDPAAGDEQRDQSVGAPNRAERGRWSARHPLPVGSMRSEKQSKFEVDENVKVCGIRNRRELQERKRDRW